MEYKWKNYSHLQPSDFQKECWEFNKWCLDNGYVQANESSWDASLYHTQKLTQNESQT